jgi:metal-sulfur cluster biosynthetic enzyme
MKNEKNIENEIIEKLKEVYDPEIPISVYDLGLIYKIEKNKKTKKWEILMTFTSESCPTKDFLKESVEDCVEEIVGVNNFIVKTTLTPKWNSKMVSKEAKEELGLFDNEEQEEDYTDFNDLNLENTFSNNNKNENQILFCFNCNLNSNEIPLLNCFYKTEKTQICHKCLNKIGVEK